MVGLRHYQEFKKALTEYQPSEQAKQTIKELNLVLLLAPTSGGRNTVIRKLGETGRYYYLISDTTRPPRINDGVMEQNGREYWFRTEEEMLQDLRKGEFLEAELIHDQQVSGISIRELRKAIDRQKTAITDIELAGMHNVLKVKPDTLAIMVLPPSFEEWQARLSGRGVMPLDEQKRRFQTALRIFDDGLKQNFYQYVISDNVEQSSAIIDGLVAGQPNPHQSRGPEVLRELQAALSHRLADFNF